MPLAPNPFSPLTTPSLTSFGGSRASPVLSTRGPRTPDQIQVDETQNGGDGREDGVGERGEGVPVEVEVQIVDESLGEDGEGVDS